MVSFKPTRDGTINIVLSKDEAQMLQQLVRRRGVKVEVLEFSKRLRMVLANALEMNSEE